MTQQTFDIQIDKIIFGHNIRFQLKRDRETRTLIEELSIYPDSQAQAAPSLVISNYIDPRPEATTINPSIHLDMETGFMTVFGNMEVYFEFTDDELTAINYDSRGRQNRLLATLGKLRSTQFTTYEETIGQRIHELLLVPSLFFNESQFLLHATALQRPGGGALLIGGTGGVGKTSSELLLCLEHNYGFISDDIAVINVEGMVAPNLAYPKLYAYNLKDSEHLRRLVLHSRSLADRIHWHVSTVFSRPSLRRRMNPADLYPNIATSCVPFERYVILHRSSSHKLYSETLTADQATLLSLSIMKTEYDAFFRQLHWHELNRRFQGRPAHLSNETLFTRWHELTHSILDNVDCELIHIPLSMGHKELMSSIVPLLTK